jgi:hypothetical protein
MEYRIEVDVIVTRTYVVEADSAEKAMAKYKSGDAEIDLNVSEMFEGNWDEQEGTARVIMIVERQA